MQRILRVYCLSVGVVILLATPAAAQRAVFLVRHAEKIDDSRDAELSEAGRARAALLARLLKDAGITAIYTSQFRRTIKTAEPLAALLKLEPTVVADGDAATVAGLVAELGPFDTALVVGHSNTIPRVLKALGHQQAVPIADLEYDNLFLLVPNAGRAPAFIRLRF